ncbi:MAG: class B sortase [Marvinbryantia sp.]|jgi:sortase B
MAKSSRNRRTQKKKGGIGNAVSTIVIVLALAVFLYAGYRLVSIYLDYKAGTDEYNALEEYANGEKVTGGFIEGEMTANDTMGDEWGDASLKENTGGLRFEDMENPIDFTSLQAINEDVIGWIEVEALDINYPIVIGDDNDYYLHRTFRHQDNFAGSIFMDYLCRSDFSGRNTIIYGHNMKNGSMFGTLHEFSKQETYDKSPYFWIYTKDRIYQYEIFSCAEVGTYSEVYQIDFASSEQFQNFIDAAKSRSFVATDTDVSLNDTVVTLSTCTGNTETRFVVQGKRVRTFNAVEKTGGYGEMEME